MKNNRGFSLVELLFTIVIISILTVVAVPIYQGYLENSKKKAEEAFINELDKMVDNYLGLYDVSYTRLSGNYGELCSPFDVSGCTPNIVDEARLPLYLIVENHLTDEIVNPNGKKDCLYKPNGNPNEVVIRRNQEFKQCLDFSEVTCLSEDFLKKYKEENNCFPKLN